MNATFTLHSDPGHGWLEVSKEDAEAVGLKVSDFSGYSYRKGSRLFLEEDCDLSLFFQAYKKTHGAYPSYVDSYSDGDFPVDMNLRGIHS